MIEVTIVDDKVSTPVSGWWDSYPRLAVYMAADVAESSGIYALDKDPPGEPAELAHAEEQLGDYPERLIHDMGYYTLIPAHCEEYVEFMPLTLVNRGY